jgi:hypothetical protein
MLEEGVVKSRLLLQNPCARTEMERDGEREKARERERERAIQRV